MDDRRNNIDLQKTDHFLCPKCGDQTFGPYFNGVDYFDGFYCEQDGTWTYDSNEPGKFRLGM